MIKKIGVEMEGGICLECLTRLKKKYPSLDRGRDGSIFVDGYCRKHHAWLKPVELRICYTYKNIKKIHNFIQDLYNTSFTQNVTCGNHMHFSFTGLKYYFVKSDFIFDYQRKYMKAFDGKEKYIKRTMNRYCRFIQSPEDLVETLKGNRYRVINFHSWFRHRTCEFRIMPYAESADEYIDQLQFNIEYIMDYLAQEKYFKKLVLEHEKSYIAITPKTKNTIIEMNIEKTTKFRDSIKKAPFEYYPYHFIYSSSTCPFEDGYIVNLYTLECRKRTTIAYLPPTWGLLLECVNPLTMCV